MFARTALVLAILLALVALALAALAALGGNWLRGPVERAALENTGRALKIGGDVKLHPGWPLLRVEASQVAFANAEWAKHPDMLTTEGVDFGLRLPQLLLGRIVIDELRLRNAEVSLEKDAQGRKNWELPGGPSRVTIQRMALDDARIAYDEPAKKTSVQAHVAATPQGLGFNAKGSFAGQPLEAHGSGGPLLALRDESEPYPFSVEASLGATQAKAQGTVTGLQRIAALDARAEVSGDSLERLYPLLGAALPETPAYRMRGRVVHDGKVWRGENFALHVGESDASGTVQVDNSGARPSVTGDIVFGLLDVTDLGATIGTRRKRERVLPDAPFNTDRWNSVDADLKLSAKKIVRPQGVPLEHFETRLALHDAVLTLDPLEFGIAGGKLTGKVRLDGRRDAIRATARLKVSKVALDRLVPGFDTSQVETGRIDGAVDLSGSGNSVAQLLGSADGTVAFLIDGGHVSRLLMEEIGLHVPRIVALKAGGDRRVPIRCAAADFKVEDGVMHTRTGVFDTTVTTVDAGGDISLRDETLDLTLTPHTKETAIGSLRTPIHVRGSFAKPDVQLEKGPLAAKGLGAAALAAANPLLALLPLIEAGPGQDSDCGRLLTASPAAADAKKPPHAAPKK
ncbi:MAG: AsmA family protein [Ignavibacteria bacterium]